MLTTKRDTPVIFALLAFAVAAWASDTSVEWGYTEGRGPQHWGELSETFRACNEGRMQSPIDLSAYNVVADVPVSVDYEPAPLVVLNDGKTVRAIVPEGSYLTSSGRVFALLQVHFHTPSEHTIGGKPLALVAHFVHASDDGESGVLGILFDLGSANGELQKILDAAGQPGPEPRPAPGVTLDPDGLLPGELDVFRYMGSLTTPPCTEGVHWHVAADRVEASAAQIAAFEALMGRNARPVQPLNRRLLIAPE